MMTSGADAHARWSAYETTDLSGALRTAIDAADWADVVRLVERDWPVLMAISIATLDAALHALPAEIWRRHPTAAAVREIRVNVRGDTAEFDRVALGAPLPSQPDEVRNVGRSAGSRVAIGMAVAFMIAYRVHGQHRKALHFANVAEALLRHARVARPDEISARVPTALLQIGITRLVAGEYHRASLLLREAYELRDESWDARVGGDAAGKLALLYAVRGETAEAERWLARHDDGASAVGWMIPLVQLSARVAGALIAVDRLDQPAAEAALRTLELQVNRERSWAPFVAFAHASFALVWGDHRAALERIARTRTFAGEAQRDTGIEPRLEAVKANLLIAVDRSGEARDVLAQRQGSPHFAASAARLALLSGDRATARELCAAGLAGSDIDARAQIDLLLTSALAEDQANVGSRYLQQALAAAARTESYAPFVLAHRATLRQLMDTIAPSSTGERLIAALAAAPEPMPHSVAMVALTSMERRVLQLLAHNASRSTIARELYVSENTVKFHTRNLYRKLGVTSRVDAVTRARQLRMLTDVE